MVQQLTQPTKSKNLWFKGHHHPWLSLGIGILWAGALSFGTDLYLYWLNRPDDLDRGPHLLDDLTYTLVVGAISGCVVYVLAAVLCSVFDFLRYVFIKPES